MRGCWSVETVRLRVTYYADDCKPTVLLVRRTDFKLFSKWILIGPVSPLDSLIYQDNWLSFVGVGFSEISAGKQRDLQHVEVFRSDGSKFRNRGALRIRRTPLNRERVLVSSLFQGQAVCAADRGFLHSRKSRDAAEDFHQKSSALVRRAVRIGVRVIRNWNPNLRSGDVARIKARTYFQNMPEAAKKKSGACEQYERQRYL